MLPAPNLDDRTFQSLVDDAKRLVQRRCPEWTDHNVHDPGVTLIETFAYMVDQLLWRLNRVPDRTYIKFLDLLGMRLLPPTAARAPVTFWLSAVQEQTVLVPAGTQVATPRAEDEPVLFTTLRDLPIVPSAVQTFVTELGGARTDQTAALLTNRAVNCFGDPPRAPQVGDCFDIGLTTATPSCAITLSFSCQTAGVGVDPRYPPIVWEAWTGTAWEPCEVDRDTTGGLNKTGDVVLHVSARHREHVIAERQAGWLRCRVVQHESWQSPYDRSPLILGLTARTSGGTVDAINADIVHNEELGVSEGVSAQRFLLRRRPVVPGDEVFDRVIDVTSGDGWEPWTEVEDFASSDETDTHFVIEDAEGAVVFGPAVRERDASLRCYGAVPEKGATIRIRSYRSGGGQRGNVARHSLTVLKSSVPLVSDVTNRKAAVGGTEGEELPNAILRGPLLLRARHRAVTADDYEHLARTAAKEIGRAHCVVVGSPAGPASAAEGIRLLLVPEVQDADDGSLEFAQLMLSEPVLDRVASYLDARRVVGSRMLLQAPDYVGLTVAALVRAKSRADPDELQAAAVAALYRYLHPIRGGPDGTGWPFGRAVVAGELHAVLQRLPDVDFVEQIRLHPANPVDRTRGPQVERLTLGPDNLLFSWGHRVVVEGQ
jgi:predicted phage baseplate assembly protein